LQMAVAHVSHRSFSRLRLLRVIDIISQGSINVEGDPGMGIFPSTRATYYHVQSDRSMPWEPSDNIKHQPKSPKDIYVGAFARKAASRSTPSPYQQCASLLVSAILA